MTEFDVRENERWCREVLAALGTFHAACLYKTRSGAGERLEKEGQNVGRSIAKLELLLHEPLNGGFLVDPDEKRKVEPTDAGRLLWAFSEELARLRAKLLEEMAALQRRSEIRIAVTQYAWFAYRGDLERAYRKLHPEGSLNPGGNFWEQDRVWEQIEAKVVSGRTDVGIYSFPPSRRKEFPAELDCIDWMKEEFVLVLSPDLAKKMKGPDVSLYRLSQLLPMLPKVVHYNRELGFDRTDLIEQYLIAHRVLPRFEGDWLTGVNTIAEIKDTLLHDGGISFLPWPTVAREHAQGLLKAFRLNGKMRPRTIKIIFRRHNCRKPVEDFLDSARTLSGIQNFPRKIRRGLPR